MDSINLVKIDGRPIEKLIEVVSNAIGTLYEPRQLVRIARAEAEAERIKAIEGAKTEALLTNNDERYAELSAIEKRIVAKESKRQNNINNVVAVAAQSLKDDKDVSSEPVNPDWATRFFDIAQDISDETMQDLWGRILAGEVKRPQSYSLRTLDVLRNITREEAELFEKIAQYVLYDGSYYIYHFSGKTEENVLIEYEDVARMIEIGFIQSGSSVTQNYFSNETESNTAYLFYASKYVAFIEITPEIKKVSFPIYSLTRAGVELYHLVHLFPDIVYFESVLHRICKTNKKCNIKYATLKKLDYTKKEFIYDDETIIEINPNSSVHK